MSPVKLRNSSNCYHSYSVLPLLREFSFDLDSLGFPATSPSCLAPLSLETLDNDLSTLKTCFVHVFSGSIFSPLWIGSNSFPPKKHGQKPSGDVVGTLSDGLGAPEVMGRSPGLFFRFSVFHGCKVKLQWYKDYQV